MDSRIFAGKAWGIPAGGGIVDFNEADLKLLLSTAAGFAKTLFKVSGGIILSLGFVGCYLLLRSSWLPIYPFEDLTKIKTSTKNFKGICKDDLLSFISGGDKLTFPISFIRHIRSAGHACKTRITLLDWSKYIIYDDDNEGLSLNFISTGGIQNIKLFGDCNLVLTGADIKEVDVMKDNILSFLDRKEEDIYDVLGKKLMEKFFYPGE